MTCQEFWNTMPELDGASDGAIHSHLKDCHDCAARMSRQRELAAGLRAMAAGYHRVAAPARVESRLRTAFRAQTGVAAVRPIRPVWAPAFTWATACAAVLALAIVIVRGRQPEVPRPAASRGAEAVIAVNTGDPQTDSDGFIQLPNAARLADTEDVNVVRVEVPRSAMIALGLEVSAERASELVAADVMLGPDGLARAVRFLDSQGSL